MDDPVPTAQLDQNLSVVIHRTKLTQQVVAVIAGLAVTAALCAAGYTIYTAATLQPKVDAACAFYFHVGSAPSLPGVSATGVEIIESARRAFDTAGCPGELPPADANLRHAAARYGIPLRY
jgi:hypothetical protein